MTSWNGFVGFWALEEIAFEREFTYGIFLESAVFDGSN